MSATPVHAARAAALATLVSACSPGGAEPSPSSAVATSAQPTAEPTSEPPSSPLASSAPAPTPLAGVKMSKLDAMEREVRATIPKGAGDFARAVALARLFKQGELTWGELEAAILDMKLPPHALGDGYLLVTPPPPPPGRTFDPKMMPKDWEGTWGVVAQAFHLGELTREQYTKLHAAAHPDCKK